MFSKNNNVNNTQIYHLPSTVLRPLYELTSNLPNNPEASITPILTLQVSNQNSKKKSTTVTYHSYGGDRI